jgi:hypothetical protein
MQNKILCKDGNYRTKNEIRNLKTSINKIMNSEWFQIIDNNNKIFIPLISKKDLRNKYLFLYNTSKVNRFAENIKTKSQLSYFKNNGKIKYKGFYIEKINPSQKEKEKYLEEIFKKLP